MGSACSLNVIRNRGYLPHPRTNPQNAFFFQPNPFASEGIARFSSVCNRQISNEQKDHMESMFHMVNMLCPQLRTRQRVHYYL